MNADGSANPCSLEAPAGLYLHVPFCLRKCSYCSFYSVPAAGRDHGRFLRAAHLQIDQEAEQWARHRFSTVFFGGGTPSALDPAALAALLARCRTCYGFIDDSPEVSIEVNPATIDARGLHILRNAGFNRLSIGIQSFCDRDLDILGRPHDGAAAEDLFRAARSVGFDNINIDLMYGLPGQNAAAWQENLARSLELAPEHLSLYELTLEPDTPISRRVALHDVHLPHEDEVMDMMDRTGQLLSDHVRYEISNYARAGYRCRHNLNYWRNGEYLGIGPGAVSCHKGRRRAAWPDVDRYCRMVEAGVPVWQNEEELDTEARFRETVIMGLRLINGVCLNALEHRFGIDPVRYYGDILPELVRQGLADLSETTRRLRLTPQGLAVANTVMARLV